MHPIDLLCLGSETANLFQSGGGVDVLGHETDEANIVAAKEGTYLVVVPFVGIIRGEEMLGRTVDAQVPGVIAQKAGD